MGIAQNERDVESYEQRISAGNLAVCRGLCRTRDDQIRREVIETILCSGIIDKTHFEKKWDICFDEYFASSLARLALLEADGLVDLRSGAIAVSDIGRIFLRVIASAFDAYLAKHQSSEKAVFSQSL